ncbi:MAG: hypothetical protein JRJ59_12080 [Deltaproteobacteria bacterium]|nr:hypothetical protein [Deltaproteobacteria bacterium]
MAAKLGLADRRSDFFLMGLFSLIDALMDKPLPQILEGIPLANDIKEALLGGQNRPRKALDLAVAYERAEWQAVSALARDLKLSEADLPPLHLESLQWSHKIFMV